MGKKDFAPIDYNKVINAGLDKVIKGYTGVKISASAFNRLSQTERVAKLKDFGGKLFASYIKKKISCLSSEHEDSTPSMGFYAGESYVGFNCLGCESKYDIFDIVGVVYHLGSFKDKYSKCVALFCEQGSDRAFKGYGNKSYAYAGSSKVKQSSFKTLTPFEKTLKNKYYIEFPESPEDETQDLTLIDAASYLKKRGIFLGSASIGNNVRYWDYNNYTYIVFVNDDGTVCRRCVDDDYEWRWWNSKGNIGIFNESALYKGQPCFICEGAFDALSLRSIGLPAVSMNSTQNFKKLLGMDGIMPILLPDRDSGGITILNKFKDKFFTPDFYFEGFGDYEILKSGEDVNEAFVRIRRSGTDALLEWRIHLEDLICEAYEYYKRGK